MANAELPLIVEPAELEKHLGGESLRVVDLCKPENYAKGHVPGAIHLEYGRIIGGQKPAPGLLPSSAQLSAALSPIGLTRASHVVAYDDEGGGRAGRLLWTLELIGHTRFSLLNGGLYSWINENHPISTEIPNITPTNLSLTVGSHAMTDKTYILDHLGDKNTVLLDARSPEEYNGVKRFTARGGHIPGAVNMNWLDTMDRHRNLRLKTDAELRRMLSERGITPDKEVIVYCQTHHRSAHSYVMLKSLGYTNIKGYPGAWSEWGNSNDTPIE